MKRLLLLLPLLLLVGCQSKRDICADYAGGRITQETVAKKLGVRKDGYAIKGYCDYYKK